MLICFVKFNCALYSLWQCFCHWAAEHVLPLSLFVRLLCGPAFSWKLIKSSLFACVCCSTAVQMSSSVCVYVHSLICLSPHLYTHTHFPLSPVALIIWVARPWAVSQSVVTHPRLFSVCVSLYASFSLCCSPALLLMTPQSTLMTRNTYSLLFCEPQLISWSVKHRKYCNPFIHKKEINADTAKHELQRASEISQIWVKKSLHHSDLHRSLMGRGDEERGWREWIVKFVCLSCFANSSLNQSEAAGALW